MLKNLRTGLIYRNPTPHLTSVHAYFPSVVTLPDGDLLASFAMGEAFEAVNLHTHLARSAGGGETWRVERALYHKESDRITSDFARISVLDSGEVVALLAVIDRTGHPDSGLANPSTLGFAPTDFMTISSQDSGATWRAPKKIESPLGDVPLEMCAPVTELHDGVRVIPTSPWKMWNGDSPCGARMIMLVSRDGGKSWPEYSRIMSDPRGECQFWESKVIVLEDGRLCAVAWVYDEVRGKDVPNRFALSDDNGLTWTAHESTGLMGQTLTPLALPDGRILSIYRRMDKSGLWAVVSHIDGESWENDATVPLWGHHIHGLTDSGDDMVENFRGLKFGAPSACMRQDGTVFVAFWAYEDNVSNIRWFSFEVE